MLNSKVVEQNKIAARGTEIEASRRWETTEGTWMQWVNATTSDEELENLCSRFAAKAAIEGLCAAILLTTDTILKDHAGGASTEVNLNVGELLKKGLLIYQSHWAAAVNAARNYACHRSEWASKKNPEMKKSLTVLKGLSLDEERLSNGKIPLLTVIKKLELNQPERIFHWASEWWAALEHLAVSTN